MEAEGQAMRVTTVDPMQLKLVGAVSSNLPQQGVVRHRGWRVTRLALPSLPPEGTGRVIAPAEVEVS
jgi:hypothetical protein